MNDMGRPPAPEAKTDRPESKTPSGKARFVAAGVIVLLVGSVAKVASWQPAQSFCCSGPSRSVFGNTTLFVPA